MYGTRTTHQQPWPEGTSSMSSFGKWILTAISPLGEEDYELQINDDGSGHLSHPKGQASFSHSVFAPNGITDIYGKTEVPMTTTFRLKIIFSDSAGAGTLFLGEFLELPIKAKRP